jgi:hypothetical protein
MTLVSYKLFFDGSDVTQPILGHGVGSGISVFNDSTSAAPAFPVADIFSFYAEFPVGFALPGPSHELLFVGEAIGPTSMFNSTALPPNLNFLGTAGIVELSGWLDDMGGNNQTLLKVGTLTPSVPEPATLTLTALGLAGALVRRRRSRTSVAKP